MKEWRREVLDKGFIELIDQMGDQWSVTSAARTSYKGENKGIEQDSKLLAYLVANGHDGTLEFCQFTFRCKAPLFVTNQWVRSRTQSYNFQSFRYTEVKDEFYIPVKWRIQDTKNKQSSLEGEISNETFIRQLYEDTLKSEYDAYQKLLSAGVAREMARMVLPTAIYTQFVFSINLRNLLHFLDLRAESHAQYEIQQYAYTLLEFVKEEFPVVYKAWELRKKNYTIYSFTDEEGVYVNPEGMIQPRIFVLAKTKEEALKKIIERGYDVTNLSFDYETDFDYISEFIE